MIYSRIHWRSILHLFISYHILVTWLICWRWRNSFWTHTPKNLHSLFKKAGEFPPSFVNLKNEVIVPWVNLWIHSEASQQSCHENFGWEILSPFSGWKYTAFSTSLRPNYVRNTCETPTKYNDSVWLKCLVNFQRKIPLVLPHPSLPKKYNEAVEKWQKI